MNKNRSGNIRSRFIKTMSILVAVSTLCITLISIAVNVRIDIIRIDENLENIAQSIAQSHFMTEDKGNDSDLYSMTDYLDSLKKSLLSIDVISVIDSDNIRRYHSNPELIGTAYDGTIPDFSGSDRLYVTSDIGPSGPQRRAYAAVYDDDGNYKGFVLAVMLTDNIRHRIITIILIHLLSAVFLIILSVILSRRLADNIKNQLQGYEPDKFSAMYSLRNNILESLEEGIIEFDKEGTVVYMNNAAEKMFDVSENQQSGLLSDITQDLPVSSVLAGEKLNSISVQSANGADILADVFPLSKDSVINGGLCILRDRTEFTKLMEDLSGVRYLVESMRANNHDFTNKLHVILGLIHMGENKKACEYISGITSIQQKIIHNIMKNIEDPSVAALLIGKYARASELDIQFSLEPGSHLSRKDISLPSGDLVTVIGNLIENAMDSINQKDEPPKELSVGIFSSSGTLIINTDDTGQGISEEDIGKIYENGYTTKGSGHGTGLFQVRNIVNKYGGTINVDSEKDTGTSFSVVLKSKGSAGNV